MDKTMDKIAAAFGRKMKRDVEKVDSFHSPLEVLSQPKKVERMTQEQLKKAYAKEKSSDKADKLLGR